MNILRIILGTLAVLLIPLIAMQFTDEVKWEFEDFIVIGGLLIGAGLGYEFVASKLKERKHRVMAGIAFVVVVLVMWVELAVGIFD